MSLIASIKKDIEAVFRCDPAATSTLEILLAYPGFHARQFHRLAHRLYRWHIPVLMRSKVRIGNIDAELKSFTLGGGEKEIPSMILEEKED